MKNMFDGLWFVGIKRLTSPYDWLLLIAILGVVMFISYLAARSFGNPLRFLTGNRWIILCILLIFFLAVGSRMQSAELREFESTPYGIVSFELAKDRATAEEIRSDLGRGNSIEAVRFELKLDFLFILTYTALLGFICFWVAEASSGPMALAGSVLGWAIPVAGLFDVIENIELLQILNGGEIAGAAKIAFWMALPKFIITIYCVALLVVLFALTAAAGLLSRLRLGNR